MPTNVEMYDAAIEFEQKGALEVAVGKLREWLALDESYALAHAALSVFCLKQNNPDEAVDHAQKVCQLESDDPFSFIALSLICQKAGRIPEAEQAMVQARQVQYMEARKSRPNE
jgi:Flp pilus assembly protein TadD